MLPEWTLCCEVLLPGLPETKTEAACRPWHLPLWHCRLLLTLAASSALGGAINRRLTSGAGLQGGQGPCW